MNNNSVKLAVLAAASVVAVDKCSCGGRLTWRYSDEYPELVVFCRECGGEKALIGYRIHSDAVEEWRILHLGDVLVYGLFLDGVCKGAFASANLDISEHTEGECSILLPEYDRPTIVGNGMMTMWQAKTATERAVFVHENGFDERIYAEPED